MRLSLERLSFGGITIHVTLYLEFLQSGKLLLSIDAEAYKSPPVSCALCLGLIRILSSPCLEAHGYINF